MDLEKHINNIGNKLVHCQEGCKGITGGNKGDQANGILPRCLNLETRDRAGARGSVVVGINPRHCSSEEKNHYREEGRTYDQEVVFWRKNNENYPYYKKPRSLINQLGLTGPILWTELVKCENAKGASGLPPLQTMRTCTELYLQKELKSVSNDWPIFSLGREPYKACAYLFPKRTVVGVPHPTGSYGYFERLFENERLSPQVKDQIERVLSNINPEAVWLKTPDKGT